MTGKIGYSHFCKKVYTGTFMLRVACAMCLTHLAKVSH